ncbi:MAG: AgmX/PglI C-terminal domain-containing protein, partial [Pseudomonadota bacterium]
VAATARAERSLVTAGAGSASGGINTASLSRNTGGTQLAGRQTTTVESDVAVAQVARETAEATGQVAASRSREEIERIFDLNKAAIYALYRRALRQDPGLQGKLVLRLTIAPSGQVVACEVVSSELNSPDLENKLVRRVRLFDFGAKDVAEVTTTKPIEFFPA